MQVLSNGRNVTAIGAVLHHTYEHWAGGGNWWITSRWLPDPGNYRKVPTDTNTGPAAKPRTKYDVLLYMSMFKGQDGLLIMWLDGKEMERPKGPNFLLGEDNYAKFGIYVPSSGAGDLLQVAFSCYFTATGDLGEDKAMQIFEGGSHDPIDEPEPDPEPKLERVTFQISSAARERARKAAGMVGGSP
jgi:hypothetical protein